MHGKTKSFFEDTVIILGFLLFVSGAYYFYTYNKEESIISFKMLEKKLFLDNNGTDNNETTDNNSTLDNNITIEKIVIMENKVVEIETKLKNIAKQEITPVPLTVPNKVKNVDLIMLRKFLRNIKFTMASNIVKRDDINSTISQELKIRVTVLKDGSPEELIYVDGDKKLFEINKENILRVFPVHIDEKIKDDFPRYVRISIK